MYGKFFSSTFTGSMVGAGAEVFAVWSYVVANAKDSLVELNPVVLAALIGAPKEGVEHAIQYLCSPDPASRNPAEDGRRLLHQHAFEYRVVSYQQYRNIRNEEDRRAYNRQKTQEWRQRKAAGAAKIRKKKDGDPKPDDPEEHSQAQDYDGLFSQANTQDEETKKEMSDVKLVIPSVNHSQSPSMTVNQSESCEPRQKQRQKQKQSTVCLSGEEASQTRTHHESITVNHSESQTVSPDVDVVLRALAPICGTRQNAEQILRDCQKARLQRDGEEPDLNNIVHLVEYYVRRGRDPMQGIENPIGLVLRMVPKDIAGEGLLSEYVPTAKVQAERLLKRLGLVQTPFDLDVVGQTICIEAGKANTGLEAAFDWLLGKAQAAVKRGENVNTFWFKEQKYAEVVNGGTGKGKPGVVKQRLTESRIGIAKALARRGIHGPWDDLRESIETVADRGQRRLN